MVFLLDTLDFIKKIVDLLRQVDSMNQLDIIEAGAYYLFQTSKDGISRHDIIKEFKKYLKPQTQSEIMTIAEAFVEEGLQKGRQEGRQESLKNILDRQIRRRFPYDVTAQHLHLINEADSDTLSDWAENLVVANSIEEVFKNF